MSGFRSVRAIIIAALLIFVIAAAAAGGTILQLRSIVIAEGVRDTTNLATVIAEQIDRSIQSIDLILAELADKRHFGECHLLALKCHLLADREICCGCTKAVGIGAKRPSRTIYEYVS